MGGGGGGGGGGGYPIFFPKRPDNWQRNYSEVSGTPPQLLYQECNIHTEIREGTKNIMHCSFTLCTMHCAHNVTQVTVPIEGMLQVEARPKLLFCCGSYVVLKYLTFVVALLCS